MAQKQEEHQISFGMAQPSSSSSFSIHPNFMSSKESNGAYDLGELDQALFLYLDAQEQRGELMPETLNIFPSQPMHEEPSMKSSKSASDPQASSEIAKDVKPLVKRKNTTSSSDHEGPKTPDPKTLRRLAQNREAARKSRLRKKAYVQQLECSRIKLAQLEQELQRSRAQGLLFGGGEGFIGEHGLHPGFGNLSSDAAMFDMEYARWLEEHHRRMCELRAVMDEHMPEHELQVYVGNCLAHYDEMLNLKNITIKTDVFHLLSGVWMAPAERCFMWLGGFRPSKIVKIIVSNLEPLTEQQLIQIYNLQQTAQENEEALSQGLESLQQSLSNTILSEALSFPSNMADYMDQMAMAMNKLSSLETFVKQADSLRQQTLHRLNQILTSRQMARCLLVIAEYFHRLRALSSLWLSRPRQE